MHDPSLDQGRPLRLFHGNLEPHQIGKLRRRAGLESFLRDFTQNEFIQCEIGQLCEGVSSP